MLTMYALYGGVTFQCILSVLYIEIYIRLRVPTGLAINSPLCDKANKFYLLAHHFTNS